MEHDANQWWSAELSVGVPEMDDSHASLLACLAQLERLDGPEFAAGFASLVAVVERDFAGEESLMETIHFAALKSHREQHARTLAGLHHALPRVAGGDIDLGRKVIALLPQWFMFHITTMDSALAAAVRAAGKAGKAPIQA